MLPSIVWTKAKPSFTENYEQRLLDVEWEDHSPAIYMAYIDIYGLNRSGLLIDILQVLSNTI